VPENNPQWTGSSTFAAVNTFLFVNNISAGIILANRIFRAHLRAFAALGANNGSIFPRVGEFCFDPQGSLFRIDLVIVPDRANLLAEAAAGAIVPVYFYPHFFLPEAFALFPSALSRQTVHFTYSISL
jgi:hypothetical protein